MGRSPLKDRSVVCCEETLCEFPENVRRAPGLSELDRVSHVLSQAGPCPKAVRTLWTYGGKALFCSVLEFGPVPTSPTPPLRKKKAGSRTRGARSGSGVRRP